MKNRVFIGLIIFTCLPWTFLSARYHPKWQWRTLQAPHFTIYYPKGYEQSAQRILSLCDEVHGDVTGYLNVKPRHCPIVLNPGTDQFNGLFTVLPNRIVLYETPPSSLKGFGPASDIMDLVFTHEYTHFAHITTRLGWYGWLSRILGDGAAISNGLSPLWITEGLATNTETLFTDGGRGRSALFAGRMMSFQEDPGLWSLSASGTINPYRPPADRYYLAGYYMIDFLNRKYGEDASAKLIHYQAKHPIRSSKGALKHVTKKSPGKFYQEFLKDFNACAPEWTNQTQRDSLPQGNILLSDPLNHFRFHAWTKAGTLITIKKGVSQKATWIEADPKTGDILRENAIGRIYIRNAKWTHENQLAFGAPFLHPLGEGDLGCSDLVLLNPNTGEQTRISKNQHIFSADLSPDGKTFAAARRNGAWTGLILLDRDGSNSRPLFSMPGMYCELPCWSPDGNAIAAVVKTGQYTEVVLINPKTGHAKALFQSDQQNANDPVFSPDGKWLVFSSNRSGIWNIYAWDLLNHKRVQLTSAPYAATDPKISQDGKTLSFINVQRGISEIRVMPFQPENGKEIAVHQGEAINKPNLKRLQPDVSFKERGIPFWEAYKPYLHIPYISSDEAGSQVGLFLIGADPIGLNSYQIKGLYGLGSERTGYDIRVINRSFWPTISTRIYDSSEEGNTFGTGKTIWHHERGAELSLSLNPIYQIAPTYISASFLVGCQYRQLNPVSEQIRIDQGLDQSLSFISKASLARISDSAARDILPNWAQTISASYEKGTSWLGGELPGHNLILTTHLFFPSLFKHHGLKMRMTYQDQGGLLDYKRDISIPRGYRSDEFREELRRKKNGVISFEYHFPLWFADRGVGLMLYHLHLIKGSLFVDYGVGWNKAFNWDCWTNGASASFGAALVNEASMLAIIPVEFGILAGYRVREKNIFINWIVNFQY